MKGMSMGKVLALLLALVMVMSVGCGKDDGGTTGSSEGGKKNSQSAEAESQGGGGEPEQDAGPYTIQKDANGNPIDLGGMEIIIRDWFSDEERPAATDNYTEARYEYWDWAQETYHFTIREAPVTTWDDCIQDMIDYVSTGGDDKCYIFHMRTDDAVFSAINSDIVYDVSTLDCLDFSEDKWVKAVTELYGKGDSVYGFRSYNMSNALGGRGIFVNKKILRDAGIEPEDLYTWQRNGEWTWSKYEEVCKQIEADTDSDGIVDRFATAGPKAVWFTMSVYSNAANFIGKDANGNFFNDLENNNTMDALNWARDTWNQYDAHKSYPDDAAWNYWETVFSTGQAAFCPAELWRAGGFYSNIEEDLGFICYPKGPNATQYANVCSDAAYYLPACYDKEKAWKIMFAFNLYTADTPGYEGYRPWRTGFYQSFGDLESVDETVTMLMDYARPAYDTGVPGVSPNEVIDNITEEQTPAQAAEVVRNSWQPLIEEANR